MSIIEKAVERLDRLKRAAGEGDSEPQRDPVSPSKSDDADPPQRMTAAETVAPTTHNTQSVAQAPAQAKAAPVSVAQTAPVRTSRVVEIDLRNLAAAGMVTPEQPKSMIAEECRVIKRPLIQNAKGRSAAPIKHANLIMVTSSLPGEGKTFNSINLAISMAMELDFTVLLVDADFSKPSVLNALGIQRQKGLMDVLTGEVDDLSSVILRTNIEKLSILPAGMPHQRATELIASEAMSKILDDMAKRYHDRIIIFDSPPLLATTESRVLAMSMGQIVIVVESDRTSHGALKSALATIEACPVKLLLLNKLKHTSAESLYGYGYGYGYGHAENKDAAVPSAS